MKEYTWEEAMAWWKGAGEYEPRIRVAAERLLEDRMPEDEGIGTSDVNHEVFHIYRHYLSYLDYIKEHKEEFSWENFLADVTADID